MGRGENAEDSFAESNLPPRRGGAFASDAYELESTYLRVPGHSPAKRVHAAWLSLPSVAATGGGKLCRGEAVAAVGRAMLTGTGLIFQAEYKSSLWATSACRALRLRRQRVPSRAHTVAWVRLSQRVALGCHHSPRCPLLSGLFDGVFLTAPQRDRANAGIWSFQRSGGAAAAVGVLAAGRAVVARYCRVVGTSPSQGGTWGGVNLLCGRGLC